MFILSDILYLIFEYLDNFDYGTVLRVCKNWNAVQTDYCKRKRLPLTHVIVNNEIMLKYHNKYFGSKKVLVLSDSEKNLTSLYKLIENIFNDKRLYHAFIHPFAIFFDNMIEFKFENYNSSVPAIVIKNQNFTYEHMKELFASHTYFFKSIFIFKSNINNFNLKLLKEEEIYDMLMIIDPICSKDLSRIYDTFIKGNCSRQAFFAKVKDNCIVYDLKTQKTIFISKAILEEI